MPRLNNKLKSVSSDLGSYTVFEQDGQSVAFTGLDFEKDVSCINGNGCRTGFGPYTMGLLSYVVFAIVMFIIMGISCIYCCCARCICRCCRCGGYCGSCCTCGNEYPTPAGPGAGCRSCLPCVGGFVLNKAGDDYEYTRAARLCAIIWMAIFIIFMVVWGIMAQVAGNRGLTTGMKNAVTTAPNGAVGLLQGLAAPLSAYLINIVGVSVVGLLSNANAVINQHVNISSLGDDLDCTLDTIHIATNFTDVRLQLDYLQLGLDNINTNFNGVAAEVNGLLSIDQRLQNDLQGLVNVVGTVNTSINVITSNVIVPISASIDEFDNATTLLLNPVDGIPTVIADLTTVASLPDDNQRNQAASGATGSLQAAVLTGDAVTADAATLLQRLQTINASYAAAPNFATTGSNMNLYNLRLQNISDQGLLNTLAERVAFAELTLGDLTSLTSTVNASVDSLLNTVNSIDLSPLRTAILTLNVTIFRDLSFEGLLSVINNKVGVVRSGVDCVNHAVQQVINFNNSIAELPSAVNDIVDIGSQLNTSVTPLYDQVQEITDLIRDAEHTRDDVNLSVALSSLDRLQTQIIEGRAQLNTTQISESLAKLANLTNLVDFASINSQISSLNASVFNNMIDQQTIQDVTDLESAKNQLVSLLAPVIQNVADYQQGYCSNAVGTLCSLTVPCAGGGACLGIGVKRCRNDGSQVCTSDGDCTSGQCVVDPVRYGTLRAALGLDQPDVSDEVAALNSTQAAAAGNIDRFKSALDSSLSQVQRIDTATISRQLDPLLSAYNGFQLNSSLETISSINETLRSVNLDQARQQLDDLDDTVSDVVQQEPQVQEARDYMRVVQDFSLIKLPSYLNRLGVSTLNQRYASGGLGDVLAQIATVVDEAVVFVQNASNDRFDFAFNMTDTEEYQKAQTVIRAITAPITEGSIQWAANVYDALIIAAVIGGERAPVYRPLPGQPAPFRVMTSADGLEYPPSSDTGSTQYCFSDECVRNEVEFVNSETLNNVLKSAPYSKIDDNGDLAKAMPQLSREHIVGLPLLIPLVIVLLALASLLVGVLCNFGWCSTCLGSWSCGCICCQLPITFLIVGVIFPLALLLGDVCHSGANLSTQYISVASTIMSSTVPNADIVCAQFDGMDVGDSKYWTAEGTAYSCVVTSSNDRQAVINPSAIIEGILGRCAQGGADPLTPVFDLLSDEADNVTIIRDQVDMIDDLGFTLRPAMRQVFLDAADGTSQWNVQLVDDMRARLGCSAISASVQTLRDAVCCDIVTAVWWAISAWYLIAWTMCCCGWSATIIGRKRFRRSLWGPAYNDLMAPILQPQVDVMVFEGQPAPGIIFTPATEMTVVEQSHAYEGGYQPLQQPDVVTTGSVYGHQSSDPQYAPAAPDAYHGGYAVQHAFMPEPDYDPNYPASEAPMQLPPSYGASDAGLTIEQDAAAYGDVYQDEAPSLYANGDDNYAGGDDNYVVEDEYTEPLK